MLTPTETRLLGEWAGWRVMEAAASANGLYNFIVIAPSNTRVSEGFSGRPVSPRDADRIIWGAAIGKHGDLLAGDPKRYAYWLQDDAYDETAMSIRP